MASVGGREALTPKLAWAVPTAFLCLMLPARAATALDYGNGATGAGIAVALFALPLLYTVPPCRAVWNRHRWRLLAAQAALTYVPFLMFGKTWVVGLSGLLAGLVLLCVRAPLSWLLFLAIVASEAVLRIGVYGIYPTPGIQYYSWVFVVPIDMGLPLFGLVRLSDLVADLRAARTELAGLAVTRERLGAARRLQAAVGDRLATVGARARAALVALPNSPDRARTCLTEAGVIARQAVEQVRRTVPGVAWRAGAPVPQRTGHTVAPRLAMLVLVVDLAAFAIHHWMIVLDSRTGPVLTPAATVAIVAIAVLQLYHSLAGPHGGRPRGWRITLPVQALLPFTDFVNASLSGLPGFPAGSALLLLNGWRAWVAFAAISSSMAGYWLVLEPGSIVGAVYLFGVSAATGLAVYGLSRLRDLAEELEATRRKLARAAAERERLRVAQDSHDLLGLGLSAIALKSDLAERLIGRDDSRAQAELHALVGLAAQARADLRAVASGEHGLSLRTELAAARDVLATVDVCVEVHATPAGAPLPPDVDAVLATVLREAVTNVLHHSVATRCGIELIVSAVNVSLRVTNDGVGGRHPATLRVGGQARRTGGQGLVNLAARAATRGGHLTTGSEGDRFELTVRIPLTPPAA